jgi:5-methylcytosine-specific restriction protein A
VTDHIVPHRGDPALLWDPANLQALCARCHNRKTALEDGGFGRAPKREKRPGFPPP